MKQGHPLREQWLEIIVNIYLSVKGFAVWLWSLKVPVAILVAILLVPKLVLLWILVVLAKPLAADMFARFPASIQANLLARVPDSIRQSPSLRDLFEGMNQALPFILIFLYIGCAPFAICWMAMHWMKSLVSGPKKIAATEEAEDRRFLFTQIRKAESSQSSNNFYYSQAFGIVMVAFFALGIPAFFSFAVYETLGIEQLISKNPAADITRAEFSRLPQVTVPRVGQVTEPQQRREPSQRSFAVSKNGAWNGLAPTGPEATYVTGYNGFWPLLRDFHAKSTTASIFFVHFYLVSVASCLCVLFFRAWFIFPLNFLSDEHDVEFTASGIKRINVRGWFRSVLSMNGWATGEGPDSLRWDEVRSLRYEADGFNKLCPLPGTAFSKESLTYKLLNKAASLIDGLSTHRGAANYIAFSAVEQGGDFGRKIKVNLNELNREQRARLFYAVKKWAPHVIITTSAEEKLVGSTVLHDIRYTQIWFDLLTRKHRNPRENTLLAGESLKGGEYIVKGRISSGGQATTYLAHTVTGGLCVLKEFVLSTSLSSGALIESAREFEAEVSLLSQLHHPGIVSLQDFFSEHGRVYVVMEYVQGQSLRQKVLESGALSEEEAIETASAVCEVLQYLHECKPPIVHRDITPENIIVQPDNKIKLIDFSLAVRQDVRWTTNSSGKQAYTPPEQFRGEVCVQSDIYALGATIFYLLTGSNPKPISRSAPKIKAPHVSFEIDAVVGRATELDLNRRYESVQWLKLDLDRLKPNLEIKLEENEQEPEQAVQIIQIAANTVDISGLEGEHVVLPRSKEKCIFQM